MKYFKTLISFIVEGPRFPDEIEEITKIEFDNVLDDGDKLYLYTKYNKLVRQETSSCHGVDVHRLMNSKGYAIVNRGTFLHIKKTLQYKNVYYEVSR